MNICLSNLKSREGILWHSSGQESVLPLQGHGFDPWSGTKIPHATQHGQKEKRKKEQGEGMQGHAEIVNLLSVGETDD